MPLMNCPECGKEVSDTANSCPNCGYLIHNKKSFLPVFIGRLFNIICPCNPHATAFQTFNPAISVRRILVPDNPPIFQRVTFTGLVTLAKHIIFSFLIFLFLFYGYYTRF